MARIVEAIRHLLLGYCSRELGYLHLHYCERWKLVLFQKHYYHGRRLQGY